MSQAQGKRSLCEQLSEGCDAVAINYTHNVLSTHAVHRSHNYVLIAFFMVALWNRETIYIFMLWFVLLLLSFFFFFLA